MSVTQAWLTLLTLSAATTLLAWLNASGWVASLAILGIGWGKAQIVLRVYLGLAQAPGWGRGFGLALALFMAAAMGMVYAAG